MFSRCKLLGLLTPNQVELLKTLADLKTSSPATFWKPSSLGAYRNSHHAKTLSALEEKGFVEKLELSRAMRPSYGYRVTEPGSQAWADFVALADFSVLAVPGRAVDRSRAQRTRLLAIA